MKHRQREMVSPSARGGIQGRPQSDGFGDGILVAITHPFQRAALGGQGKAFPQLPVGLPDIHFGAQTTLPIPSFAVRDSLGRPMGGAMRFLQLHGRELYYDSGRDGGAFGFRDRLIEQQPPLTCSSHGRRVKPRA
jgi:hypothetical protein